MMLNLTGQSIGRYHILEQLGEGGMATVYKAYDTRLERNVAFKVLRTDLFGSAIIDQILKRFEREAKSLAKLSHPNIVNILDYGEHEGNPYLVMEYLPGGTLKQKLGQVIPWQEAIHLLLPVARGLAYAHQHGVIHRDVKPANILMKEGNIPVLTDFGIAKLLEGADGHTLTASGVGIGTPEYMAPEQGIGAHTIDARADIYSLGIVLYEMVTGRKPYIADTPMAVVLKQMTDPLPRPTDFVPDLPEEVEHILFKALAKQPEDRYVDMNALIAAMEGVLMEAHKFETSAPITRVKKKVFPSIKLSPKLIAAFIGILVIVLMIFFSTPWIKQQLPAVSMAESKSTFTLLPPTIVNTPAPGWVTDFAEPILAAIKDREPDFQDDFSVDTHQWYVCCSNTPDPIIAKGVMSLSQDSSVSNYYFLHKPNIVFQVDVVSPIYSMQAITLASNADQLDPLKLQLDPPNQWSVLLHSENIGASGSYQSDGKNIQLMYIVNGPHVAFYVNETPVAHLYYSRLLDDTENERLFQCGDTCYFDNVKLWNLDNIPLPANLTQGSKPTETHQPTPTSTPLPAWVTNFAEPILAAIKDRAPDFQDDFSVDTTQRWYGTAAKNLVINKGVMCVLQGESASNYYFINRPNNVLQVDVLPPIKSFSMDLNPFGKDADIISVNSNSEWSVGYEMSKSILFSGKYNDNGQKTQILVIVKGAQVAYYINEIPMAYLEDPGLLENKKYQRFIKCDGTCCFDNVKFWNLDNIPNMP